MDTDFWTSRIAAAKRQFNLQHHHHLSNSSGGGGHHSSQLDRFNIDDFEVEEDIRPDFPCPYCYEEFDIASLCSHLEDEHSFESRATVCPVCSVKVTSDMLSHITLQHGYLFKISFMQKYYYLLAHKPWSRRVAIPNSQALSLLGRDLREAHLQLLLGGSGYRSNNATSSNATTDSFLSSLVSNLSASETDEISKSVMSSIGDNSSTRVTSQNIWKSSFDSSLSREEREKGTRQAAGRAVFVRDLLISTLLAD
ncbi:Hypothetical predicted protein [Olea europaea subsp. europaea]|uniref:Uncharacterized protein n=1 Tax=Olea europaea subsp. europaea TaxID=158383 RepID=A0A8S0V7N5_OLEEU|nr:Hypothetical predicted protein [Olea europaea subsp. europaea]